MLIPQKRTAKQRAGKMRKNAVGFDPIEPPTSMFEVMGSKTVAKMTTKISAPPTWAPGICIMSGPIPAHVSEVQHLTRPYTTAATIAAAALNRHTLGSRWYTGARYEASPFAAGRPTCGSQSSTVSQPEDIATNVERMESSTRNATKQPRLPRPISLPTNSQKWSKPLMYRCVSRDMVYSLPGWGSIPESLDGGIGGTPGLTTPVAAKQTPQSAHTTRKNVLRSIPTRSCSGGSTKTKKMSGTAKKTPHAPTQIVVHFP
mmetsp:Transcript_43415/g.114087  ORF Transcript_43415/g.114087 Transcript_43415/m.114087 type:complete len:259 (+) Transcript_43415:427-1203(+)